VVQLRTPEGAARTDREVIAELGLGQRTTRRVLVVLDDAAGEEQVRSVLAELGDAAVLVTSRRRLTGLETATHLRLEPLCAADGVRLLGRLAGEQRVAAEPQAAYRLVELCGGLPLALRIAGAKLCAVPHLPLARYADRLADERRVVDRLCAGDLRLRPRLSGWLSDVPPDDRDLLRRLATGAGTQFSAAEAAESLGDDVADVEDAIERLFEVHLVETRIPEVQAHAAADAVCFGLPPLLRALLRESA
jgi:hypothetical protein